MVLSWTWSHCSSRGVALLKTTLRCKPIDKHWDASALRYSCAKLGIGQTMYDVAASVRAGLGSGFTKFRGLGGLFLYLPRIELAEGKSSIFSGVGVGVRKWWWPEQIFKHLPLLLYRDSLQTFLDFILACRALTSRERKISPKFSCTKFSIRPRWAPRSRDIPSQIPGHPGHSLS